MTSQERVKSTYCCFFPFSYSLTYTEIKLAVVSRYGEYIPGSHWGT